MKPILVKYDETELRHLEEGSLLKIFFDSENSAKNFSMGWVSFDPGSRTSVHTRDVEEVIFVLKGETYIVTTDHGEFFLRKGDCVLIPAGIEHYHANRGDEVLEQIYLFSPQGPEKPLRNLSIVTP